MSGTTYPTYRHLKRGAHFQWNEHGAYYTKRDHNTYQLLDLTTREPIRGMLYSLTGSGRHDMFVIRHETAAR